MLTLALIGYAAGILFLILAGWRWNAPRPVRQARLRLIQGGKDTPHDQSDGLEAINATDTHGGLNAATRQ